MNTDISETNCTIRSIRVRSAMPSVTETLRNTLEHCGQTRYAVSKATGIPQSTLSRFVAEGRALRGDNIDVLAEYLDLQLVAKASKRKGAKRG